MRVEVMWKRTLRSGGMLWINKKSKSVAREKTCVNEKQAHRKVSMQAVEIVKVDEFKVPEVNHSMQQTVHTTGEEESGSTVDWEEMLVRGDL